jgi:hypothetical protein
MKKVLTVIAVLILGLCLLGGNQVKADWYGRKTAKPYWQRNCGPYWRSPYWLGNRPYGYYFYPFGYLLYPYPYADFYDWRYYPYRDKSPYSDLEIKPAGEVLIQTDPFGAEVYVDGYLLKMNEQDSVYRLGLFAGRHRVKVKAQGYKPYQREIEIQTGKRVSLFIRLKKERRKK